jgi:hypothetical protein
VMLPFITHYPLPHLPINLINILEIIITISYDFQTQKDQKA